MHEADRREQGIDIDGIVSVIGHELPALIGLQGAGREQGPGLELQPGEDGEGIAGGGSEAPLPVEEDAVGR